MAVSRSASPSDLACVDPALLHAWVRGWARSRGLEPPFEAYGGWRVDVGLPDQRFRIVFPGLTDGFRQALAEIDDPDVLLKVCAPPDALGAALLPGWTQRWPSTLMDLVVTDDVVAASPQGYQLVEASANGRVLLQVMTSDGVTAAGGVVSLVDGYAVFDRIETQPEHRRRGLGSVMMRRLCALAASAGARRGLLVATADGRALYETLGWRALSPYCTAVRALDTHG